MVVCSAIKIKVKLTDKEVVVCGLRHCDCYKIIKDMGLERDDYIELEQGFINNRGAFMDRQLAFKHAADCGQLSATVIHYRPQEFLTSEDIY